VLLPVSLDFAMVEIMECGDETPEQNRNEDRDDAPAHISMSNAANESPQTNERQDESDEIEKKVDEH
jgi:hypothetical protein